MTDLVVAGALTAAAINALAGAYGGWRWYREQPSSTFWILLRAGQVAALALAIAVGVLGALGHSSSDQLFYLYALLPIPIGLVAEQLRIVAAETVLAARDLESARDVGRLPDADQRSVVLAIIRREIGVMAAAAVVVCFLALRAAGTAAGF